MHIARGFEERSGLPNVMGAIDGCLFRICRFADFEGWYCRKGYPALNMQAVVDHKNRFMSFSIRSGSQNDKAVFNHSRFGQTVHSRIPRGCYFLADAGYQLFAHIMTPYKIELDNPPAIRHYNYLHSRARMAVECAFGLLKGKFRHFKKELVSRSPKCMEKTIVCAMILHNWFIDLRDGVQVAAPVGPTEGGWDVDAQEVAMVQIAGAGALAARDRLKDFLAAYVS